jgi:hypothetical protein
VLRQTMQHQQHSAWPGRRRPALIEEQGASFACKMACVLLDCHALIPYSALVFLMVFTLLGAVFASAEAAVIF